MVLDVLYNINNKYIDIMLVSITSLVLNNKSYDKIRLHVICSFFEVNDYIRLETYVSNFCNVSLYLYSLDKFDITRFNIPDWRGNQIANARLFYQSIIDVSGIDKLLYLDADTIVVSDLGELNSYDCGVMAVKDSGLKSYMESLGINKYYNSGVLLFDVEKWKNDLCEEKIIKFLNGKSDCLLTYPDQDILNIVLGDYITDLDYKYNIGHCFMMENDLLLRLYFNRRIRQIDYLDVKKSVLDAKIFHNYGILSMKPWVNNKLNPFDVEFKKYMDLVNPNFKREELEGIKKFLVNHKQLFYTILVLKSYMSDGACEKIKKLIFK